VAVRREAGRSEDSQPVVAFDLIGEERLIEPDELDRAARIFEHRLEDFHALDRRHSGVRRNDAAADQHRLVDVVPEVGDRRRMAPVFIAIREEPEQIARRRQPMLVENFRSRRADAFEEADGRVRRNHTFIVARVSMFLRRVEG